MSAAVGRAVSRAESTYAGGSSATPSPSDSPTTPPSSSSSLSPPSTNSPALPSIAELPTPTASYVGSTACAGPAAAVTKVEAVAVPLPPAPVRVTDGDANTSWAESHMMQYCTRRRRVRWQAAQTAWPQGWVKGGRGGFSE